MKTPIVLLIFIIFLSGFTLAQNKIALNFTGNVNIGLSDFGDTYGTGLGGTAAVLYSTSNTADLTLSIGYKRWSKDSFAFTSVPILAGFRYYFPLKSLKLYIPANLGMHITTRETELPIAEIEGETVGGGTISFSDNFFGFGIGFGVLVPLSPTMNLDINTTFNSIASSESNTNFISGNIGLQLGL